MFLLYYFAIFIAFTQNVVAQDIQTLEEINAELIKKKAELEPFNDKDIKIDLESLGLDDVNKKEETNAVVEVKKEIKQNKEDDLKLPNLNEIMAKDNPTQNNDNSQNIVESPSTESPSIISKIKNVITSDIKESVDKSQEKNTPPKQEVKKEEVKEVIKNENKKIEEVKKKEEPIKSDKKTEANSENTNILESMSNNIDAPKENIIKSEEKPIIQNKKLQKLREQYLIKVRDRKSDLVKKEFSAILPKRKTVNPFISDELPAVPILNNYRTVDNEHIPIFLSYEERVNTLFDAVSYDNVAFFNSAYANVKNPNIKNALGDTILTYSILLGRHDIMISAINKGANVDLPNSLGYRPLDIAIELLDFKAFEILVNNNADIYQLDLFGKSYLTSASRVGFLSAVKVLIIKGLDVNLIDKEGFTPLTVAYRNNRELVARYLLKNGAKNQNNIDFNRQSKSIIKELENRWK